MNNKDILQRAKDIEKVITEGIMHTESIVARVLNYCLKRDEEVKKEIENEIFSRLYEEIRENFQKDSALTGQELLIFIQHVEFQMLKEAKE